MDNRFSTLCSVFYDKYEKNIFYNILRQLMDGYRYDYTSECSEVCKLKYNKILQKN